MRTVIMSVLAFSALFTFQSCSSEQARYVDLNTNRPFELVKHPKTGLLVDAETGKPLNIYVDTKTQDTIYGRTGEVINGQVTKLDKSFYAFAQAETEGNHQVAGASTSNMENSDVHFGVHKSAQ